MSSVFYSALMDELEKIGVIGTVGTMMGFNALGKTMTSVGQANKGLGQLGRRRAVDPTKPLKPKVASFDKEAAITNLLAQLPGIMKKVGPAAKGAGKLVGTNVAYGTGYGVGSRTLDKATTQRTVGQ